MAIIDSNACFGAYPSRHRAVGFDELSSSAEARGIDQSCVCSTTGIFYNDREGNLETVNAAASQPGRLLAAATINPTTTLDPETVVAEIVAGPFKLVRFFPDAQGWPVDFAPFAQCLRYLSAAKLPVMISCGKSGDSSAIARLACDITDGSLPVIMEGVTGASLAEAMAAMRDCAALHIETHSLVFADVLTALRDALGVERIVYGSGATSQSVGATLNFVRNSPLSDSEKDMVLGGNAERILGASA